MSPKQVGLKFQALADGQTWLRIKGCPLVGQWLMRFDPDAHGGLGEAEFTWDEEDAVRFDSFEAADAFWRQPSAHDPRMIRELGSVEEHRPLMVVSVEVAPLS